MNFEPCDGPFRLEVARYCVVFYTDPRNSFDIRYVRSRQVNDCIEAIHNISLGSSIRYVPSIYYGLVGVARYLKSRCDTYRDTSLMLRLIDYQAKIKEA